jgi:hypothetical protein
MIEDQQLNDCIMDVWGIIDGFCDDVGLGGTPLGVLSPIIHQPITSPFSIALSPLYMSPPIAPPIPLVSPSPVKYLQPISSRLIALSHIVLKPITSPHFMCPQSIMPPAIAPPQSIVSLPKVKYSLA